MQQLALVTLRLREGWLGGWLRYELRRDSVDGFKRKLQLISWTVPSLPCAREDMLRQAFGDARVGATAAMRHTRSNVRAV